MRRAAWIVLAALLWLAGGARAAEPDLRGFAFDQHPGMALPRAVFRDQGGVAVPLSAEGGRPLIVDLGYFRCPNLCGIARDDLLEALGREGLVAGRDYDLVVLSIDPSETAADASAAMAKDLLRYDLPGARAHWRYLTGRAEALGEVEESVGLRDRFDPARKQFLHPTGIVFVTPNDAVSGYLLGVGYAPSDVRLGLTRAAGNLTARALPVLLLCFHFDPSTGRYTLAVMRLVQAAAVLTVVAMGGTWWLATRRGGRAAR